MSSLILFLWLLNSVVFKQGLQRKDKGVKKLTGCFKHMFANQGGILSTLWICHFVLGSILAHGMSTRTGRIVSKWRAVGDVRVMTDICPNTLGSQWRWVLYISIGGFFIYLVLPFIPFHLWRGSRTYIQMALGFLFIPRLGGRGTKVSWERLRDVFSSPFEFLVHITTPM